MISPLLWPPPLRYENKILVAAAITVYGASAASALLALIKAADQTRRAVISEVPLPAAR